MLGTPPPFCTSDTIPLAQADAGARRSSIDTALIPRGVTFSPTLLAEVAVDTDEEFLAKFQSTNGALAYLAELAAVVSAIYEADVGVRVVFRFIRLWATTDPWTATSPGPMVYQVSQHWANNETAISRDVVHFISGKSPGSGAAFLDGLCNAFGYGASIVNGAFDPFSPADIWDVYLVAHELGHNFGSVHTHCYNPPLDHCYNQESGCWSGAFDVPPEGGTLMSYCGLDTINLTFGDTVRAVLRAGAEAAACLGPPCGDGALDPGEECDDGNCCSASCTAGPDGGSCDDGNVCTTDGTCMAGVCVATPWQTAARATTARRVRATRASPANVSGWRARRRRVSGRRAHSRATASTTRTRRRAASASSPCARAALLTGQIEAHGIAGDRILEHLPDHRVVPGRWE